MSLYFFPPCSYWDLSLLVFTLPLSLLLLWLLFFYTHNQYNYPNNYQKISYSFKGFLLAEQWDVFCFFVFFFISSLWLGPSIWCFCYFIITITIIIIINVVILLLLFLFLFLLLLLLLLLLCIEEARGEAVRFFSPRCHTMPKQAHVPWKTEECLSHLCEIWSHCVSTTSHTQFRWLDIVKGWCIAPA